MPIFIEELGYYFDGLAQERCNSIANALELHLSCTNPSILSYIMAYCSFIIHKSPENDNEYR